MKKKELYESPSVEVLNVKVEKGFAVSPGTEQMEEKPGEWETYKTYYL